MIMTVRINKNALNLREELTKAQGVVRYEQRQFWMDGLVENGTFDSDTSGWTDYSSGSGSASWNASGYIDLTGAADGRGQVHQAISTIIGVTYVVKVEVTDSTPFQVIVGTSAGGNQLHSGLDSSGDKVVTFTATTTTSYVALRSRQTVETVSLDNVAVFEVDESDNVIHSVPLGFKPVHVYEDGLLQREGENHDYTVVDTGFGYQIKPTVAPSATTETCVIAEREL